MFKFDLRKDGQGNLKILNMIQKTIKQLTYDYSKIKLFFTKENLTFN